MTLRHLALVCSIFASAGCAHIVDNEWRCRFTETPSLPYMQMSRTFQVDNLPESTLVAAHFYSLRSTRATVSPCSNLAIVKELHIRTAPGRDLHLREHRSLVDARGRVIAERNEDISQQITVTATYRGVVALNIPATMHTGVYRLISTIYVDGLDAGSGTGGEPITLNRASTTFTVAMPDSDSYVPTKTSTRTASRRAAISKNRIP